MPDVQILIGGREFTVACQPGEEDFLHSAAAMLDAEVSTLVAQVGRLPESRMLLMAGLMLADRTTAVEEKLREAEQRLAEADTALRSLSEAPPERVEVPVVPTIVIDTLAEIAARAEALADRVEERQGS